MRRALAHLFLASGIYAGLFLYAVAGARPVLRIAASLVAGLFSGNLFMIGHDACHGSYTRVARLDRVLGRIAFLPSYHPFSLWELSHNRTHHVFTNLKGRDFVWAPATKVEYDAQSWAGRLLYRAYRTPLGLALYYPIEIWFPRHAWPRRALVGRAKLAHRLDRLLVAGFFSLQLCAVALLSGNAWVGAALGIVLPWLVFDWLIGFVIYFNHTHPEVRWFGDPEEWTPFEGIIAGTARLNFPEWAAPFESAIMNHVAHHVDPRIALVHLEAAQNRIEALVGGRVIVQPWSVAALLDIFRRCKLYDFEAGCWLDYSGRPTTASTLPSVVRERRAG